MADTTAAIEDPTVVGDTAVGVLEVLDLLEKIVHFVGPGATKHVFGQRTCDPLRVVPAQAKPSDTLAELRVVIKVARVNKIFKHAATLYMRSRLRELLDAVPKLRRTHRFGRSVGYLHRDYRIFNPDGFGGLFSQPAGLCMLNDDHLCICDKNNARLQVFEVAEEPGYVRQMHSVVMWPVDVCVGDGLLHVAIETGGSLEACVVTLNPSDGSLVRHANADMGPGVGKVSPMALAFSRGELLVVDYHHDSDDRIIVLSASTLALVRVMPIPTRKRSWFRSLAVHDDELFVLDSESANVLVLSRTGEWLRTIVGKDFYAPPPDGRCFEFGFPVGVAVAHDRVFLAEENSTRLQVLTLDGLHIQTVDFDRPLNDITVHPGRLEVYVTSGEGSVHILAVRDDGGEEEGADEWSVSEHESEEEQEHVEELLPQPVF